VAPMKEGGGGQEPCWLCRLHFTVAFAVHALPITDKGEAVLCSMWFHLEQVKQCRKIDPSSVAFQRPVRNSAKSKLILRGMDRVKAAKGPGGILSGGLLTVVKMSSTSKHDKNVIW